MIFEAQKDFFKQNMKTVIDKETTLVNVIASKLYRDDETARAAGEGHSGHTGQTHEARPGHSVLTRSCEKTTTHSLCRGRTRDCDRLLTEKPSKGCDREKAPPSPPETEIQRRPPERLGAELRARSGALGSVPREAPQKGHADEEETPVTAAGEASRQPSNTVTRQKECEGREWKTNSGGAERGCREGQRTRRQSRGTPRSNAWTGERRSVNKQTEPRRPRGQKRS